MKRPISTLLSVGLAVGLAACGSAGSGTMPTQPGGTPSPTPSPQTATVAATASIAFSPATVSVKPGGVVTFSFGSVGHNVHFDTQGAPASITGSNANTSIAVTFPTAGTYNFHCTIHPQMTGTVVVADSSMTTNSPPPTGY